MVCAPGWIWTTYLRVFKKFCPHKIAKFQLTYNWEDIAVYDMTQTWTSIRPDRKENVEFQE